MYVCGPTVYDEPHIGHLRSAYVFDVMRRYLAYSGYEVKFVRNVTDVDDKIIEKAKESVGAGDLNAEVEKVSSKYLDLYKKDLQALGILEPTHEPKATGHIPDMQWLIQKLIEGGKAYASGGDVYFDVNGFKDYGKLSHQKKEAILENVRIDKNEKKRDVLDFALWKKVKEGEPSWPSPWGDGRPGWHIECSAMSMKYLGETFDIHGGGRDLIFPHHENEVAQSEAVTGSPFAKYWVHHGLITVNEQKMSKSLKNYITLKQVVAGGPSRIEELKFLFLGTHYSAPLDYSEEKMKMEHSIIKRFKEIFYKAEEHREKGFRANPNSVQTFLIKMFRGSMDHDFNTPDVITHMHGLVNMAFKNQEPTEILSVAEAIGEFSEKVFGISFNKIISKAGSDDNIQKYINERDQAKKDKNFKLADQIREELKNKFNVELIDSKDKPTGWRYI